MRRMSRIFNSLSALNHQSPSALYFLSASIVSTEVPLDSELHCPWRLCAFLLLLLLCICTLVGWIHLGEPVKPNNDGSSWLHQIMVGSSLPPFADRMRSLELGHMYESSDLFACTKKRVLLRAASSGAFFAVWRPLSMKRFLSEMLLWSKFINIENSGIPMWKLCENS